MADVVVDKGGSGGNTALAFIVGAVLVAVAVLGFFMWDNAKSGGGAPAKPAASITVDVNKK